MTQTPNLISTVVVDPTGVNMERVASATRAIEDLDAGRLAPGAAMKAINTISQAAAGADMAFHTLAAAAGAVALAVIFGVEHLPAAALVSLSAAAAQFCAASIAPYSANVFLQPFGAGLLAGVIGALAVRYELSSSSRLISVCPCMILVPGAACA